MSSTYTQADRQIAIYTPLADDMLLLKGLTMTEEIGRPFVCQCDLRSEYEKIDFSKLLGEPAAIRIETKDGKLRFINGIICRVGHSEVPRKDRLCKYQMTIVPALWFLTRAADCCIFQNKSVMDVINEVLNQFGVTNVRSTGVKGTYAKREYIVQYRETAFNFISRLMEEEGIFYYFIHEKDKHIMVLADEPTAHEAIEGYDKIEYKEQDRGASGHQFIWRMLFDNSARPGNFVLRDFDFKTPDKFLDSTKPTAAQKHDAKELEVYDYPGFYETKAEGDRYAKVRMEESDAMHATFRFEGNVRGIGAGCRFTMTDYPTEAGNIEYVAVATHFTAEVDEFGTGGAGSGGGGEMFHTTFTAIDAKVPFRTARTTPKPCISGPQTAFVTGPSGEEIFCDEFGRVKVQFHWDRDGKVDDKSSCFVRVSQGWAGKKWGMVFLPRIGHEVIVEFLEGDPDRPIITGRVYNGREMPPYKLPDMKTVSTIKSCSSKGGEGFNEIRFEDKKGDEQLFIHAEKNMDIRVKNDTYETILNDRHLVVARDQLEEIKRDRSEKITRDTIQEIGRDRNVKVKGKEAVEVTGSHSFKVTGAVIEEFADNCSTVVTKDAYLKAKNIVIEALENITFKVTDNSYISIEKDSISIKTDAFDLTATKDGVKIESQKDITVESKTGGLTTKSKMDTAVDGMNVNLSAKVGFKAEGKATAEMGATKVEVAGKAMCTIKGGMVMIN